MKVERIVLSCDCGQASCTATVWPEHAEGSGWLRYSTDGVTVRDLAGEEHLDAYLAQGVHHPDTTLRSVTLGMAASRA